MADRRAGRPVVTTRGECRVEGDIRGKAHDATAGAGADGAQRLFDHGCNLLPLPLCRVVISFEQGRGLERVALEPRSRGSEWYRRQGDRCKDRDDGEDADDLEQREPILPAGEITAYTCSGRSRSPFPPPPHPRHTNRRTNTHTAL